QTETVWRQASKYDVPRIVFVNKMDRVGADFDRVVNEVREKLGATPVPVLIPIGAEEALCGQIDVINQRAIIYTDDGMQGSSYSIEELDDSQREVASAAYLSLVEEVASHDELVGEQFLMEEEIGAADLKAGLRRATIANKLIPIAGGSAFKNKGVQYLCDAVIDYLPSPLDIHAAEGQDPADSESKISVETDDREKFVGLAFKLWGDKFVGKLVFFRVYSGTVSKGDVVYNPRTRKKERVGRLIQIQANEHEDVDVCYSGDIAAIVGLKEVKTGDTLTVVGNEILLEPPTFPEPVISMAIEPRTKADQDRMALGLQRLSDEDPTFLVKTDEETGQTIISGMGELHLEVIRDRLFREFKVEANSGKPQIAYRETITCAADGEGKLVKQSGGRGQYGHVILKVVPGQRGDGLTTENKVVGGNIPREFINACISGVGEAMLNGVIAGYPVIDVHVEIVDGSSHDVDSSEQAFKMAAIFAMKDAFRKAKPVMLEPVMKVECLTPDDYQGDIMGDLNRRRGKIGSIEAKPRLSTICCDVPLAEMFGYSTAIRTLSSGRASYSMEPSHFEEVPQNIVNRIIEQSGGVAA
ncbi:MAG: elongation factor G, partial [Verrucomicrobiales bacterium]|nr:elongation factor G [Verrucomicrobiales bacterium]